MANKKNQWRRSAQKRTTSSGPEIDTSAYEKQWYTNDEICAMLKLSMATIKRRRKDGSLRASKNFGKISFHARDIEAFLRGGYTKAVAGLLLIGNLPGVAMEIW